MVKLNRLRDHSYKIGSNPLLVQANGGNTSLKIDDCIYVKGSGKYLRDAHSENIFCKFLLKDILELDFIQVEDFRQYLCQENDSSLLMPSLETNFHFLLPNPIISHIHSLGAVSLSVISPDLYREELESNFNIAIIPYGKPGPDLARLISEYSNLDSSIYLLQNHGAIFCGESFDEIENMIDEFEQFAIDLLSKLPNLLPEFSSIDILNGGILTPDEAVYLGRTPDFGISSVENSDLDYVEIFNFYKIVSSLIEFKSKVHYLQEEDLNAILSWDKEILRREQERQCNL